MYFLIQFIEENLGVMSVGFLLSSPDDAVIWRGPKKNGEWETSYTYDIVSDLKGKGGDSSVASF